MKNFRPILIVCSLAAGMLVISAPAFAVPPTAQFNPGYERRLSESRQPRHYYSVPVRPYRARRPHRHWYR